MNKKTKYLTIAIVWTIIGLMFFIKKMILPGITWSIIGIFYFIFYFRIKKKEKTDEILKKALNNMIKDETFNTINTNEVLLENININGNEVHKIEDFDYCYYVDKSFKEAKSHSAEVLLLCTYAPNDEYGTEGNLPCISILIDDDVYCAVEEYKKNKNFDNAITIEHLQGKFLFRAKMEYFDDMMYFYAFNANDKDDFLDMTGLCLVYQKEYVGTENEKKLMSVLDNAAKTFEKINNKNN